MVRRESHRTENEQQTNLCAPSTDCTEYNEYQQNGHDHTEPTVKHRVNPFPRLDATDRSPWTIYPEAGTRRRYSAAAEADSPQGMSGSGCRVGQPSRRDVGVSASAPHVRETTVRPW